MNEGDVVRGCRIEIRPALTLTREAASDTPAPPTLGEIVDKLAAQYPDRAWPCAPTLRDVRISSIVVRGR